MVVSLVILLEVETLDPPLEEVYQPSKVYPLLEGVQDKS